MTGGMILYCRELLDIILYVLCEFLITLGSWTQVVLLDMKGFEKGAC